MNNVSQYIEQFHLLFLDQLGRKIDQRLYALKGGCNLRFYFKSMRYSEDLDLDVQTMRKDTLLKNVQTILESKTFTTLLQLRDIVIKDITEPTQTETTQRWKITLNIATGQTHTKIEFSRRGLSGTILFEAIDALLIQHYHLPPILTSHYDKPTAILQKINALADRKVTQVRDVFDLYLLLSGNATLPSISNLSSTQKNQLSKQITKALDNIAVIHYQDFRSQVIAFLATEYQIQYATQEIWQQIISNVKLALSRGVLCN